MRQTKFHAENLEEFISSLEGELRTGGVATLDELYNLAIAIKADLEAES